MRHLKDDNGINTADAELTFVLLILEKIKETKLTFSQGRASVLKQDLKLKKKNRSNNKIDKKILSEELLHLLLTFKTENPNEICFY